MSKNPRTSGFTVLEAMIAMAVLLLGATGLVSLQSMGSRMNGDARVMTRAAAIAQDLVSQMQTWNYVTESEVGGRLENVNTGNDGHVLFADEDAGFEVQKTVDSALYDHEETELEGGPWMGLPAAEVAAQGFTRYWNVSPYIDETTHSVLGLNVAVIVRWDRGGAPRRIVLTTFLRDPGIM